MVHEKDIHDDFDVEENQEIDTEAMDIDLETEDESLKDKIKSLRAKLAEYESEKQNLQDDLQRTRADFLNSKRRLEEQFIRDKERATDKILSELLTLVDSFDTAMVDKALWETIDARWRVGVEAIHTKLLSIFKSNNVHPFDPVGEAFNPEEHEAVSSAPVTDASKAETVIAVLQKGFKRNNEIIRPAKVVVGHKE